MQAKTPKVSVCVITYNQKNYIQQCLQSIINQKADFDFELIVGDDFSTDGTAEIVESFLKNYSGMVKFVKHHSNVGAKSNLRSVFRAACGEYVAICEGDDFWNDEKKLDKQVKLMDIDKEISLTHSNVRIAKYFLGKWRVQYLRKNNIPTGDIRSQLWSGWFNVHTASIVIRRNVLLNFINSDGYRPDLISGDWPIVFYAAYCGRIEFMPDCFATYRHAMGSLMRSGDSMRIRMIRERVIWWGIFIDEFGEVGIRDEKIIEIASKAMVDLGYKLVKHKTPIFIDKVGYFEKSISGQIFAKIKRFISLINFLVGAKVL